MNYAHMKEGWRVTFLDADCKTPLPKRLTFASSDKIVQLAKNGGADFTSASRCDLENGIQIGRGGMWLNLTAEQYQKLR